MSRPCDIERASPGPRDALLRIRACGICGTDVTFVHLGGMPYSPGGSTVAVPLGHEPAGEIVEVGADVTDLKVGDHVVVNPQGAPSGIIGCGGPLGGMDEYLLIEDAEVGRSVAVLPGSLPFDIAALNEPTAVARHCVNRSEVTAEIAEHRDRFARLISHRVPFAEVGRAFELAMTPGAAEKVVVTFE